MRKIMMLPTWVLVNIMTPILPKNHPWKNKHFSLKDWSDNATNLTFWLSFMMWYSFINLIMFIVIINNK